MRKFYSFFSVFIFFLIWFLLVHYGFLRFVNPISAFKSFLFFLVNEDPITGRNLLYHSYASLRLVFLGTGIGFLVGVTFGILMGWYKLFNRFFEPIVELLRPIPGIAWFPIAIIFFGIYGSVFIVFLCAVFHILINTIFGIRSVKKNLIDTARILGAKEWEIIVKILIPSAFPYIIAGTRMGIGTGFLGLVSSEMIAFSSAGLGFFILTMHSIGHLDKMVAGMFMIGIVGFFLNKLLLKIGEFYQASYD
jgi:NitT/TauT family transport system permease protein